MDKPVEAECNRILIVEGHSDLLFCAELLEHLGKLDGVFIKMFNGRDNIVKRKILEVELGPNVLAKKQAVGILVDADDDAAKVSARLQKLILDITGQQVSEGSWSTGNPRLGFFVAPDGVSQGELETLVWKIWSAKAEHAEGKDSVLVHLSKMEAAGWKAKSPDKARIGAFLSAAYDEDPRLGAGAREGLFDFDDPGYERLRNFLNQF